MFKLFRIYINLYYISRREITHACIRQIRNSSLLITLLQSRLEKKHSCKESSDKEIDDAAKDWRRLSLDREGGKKQRREKKNNIYK